MILSVIIPAYNEEKTIARVIAGIPRKISGVEMVSVIVIDDGSEDSTSEEAKKAGADIVIRHRKNMGLAVSFRQGLDAALENNSGAIINIDADGQYDSSEIPKIAEPILSGKADLVL